MTKLSLIWFHNFISRYLKYYQVSELDEYTRAIEMCDFSAVNVFFVSSVPDAHKGAELNRWGHRQVASILRANVPTPAEPASCPLLAQCSSIGSMGPTADTWLTGEFGRSLSACKSKHGLPTAGAGRSGPMYVVYPSKRDVFRSHDGVFGGGCLPYAGKTAAKQPWLEPMLRRWRSAARQRDRAMPHIKTYARTNREGTRAAYFMLTSANLSKPAWGSLNKAGDSFQVQSYEAGVLALPQFTVGKNFFELGKELRLPYDLPLEKYEEDDTVWLYDYLREAAATF